MDGIKHLTADDIIPIILGGKHRAIKALDLLNELRDALLRLDEHKCCDYKEILRIIDELKGQTGCAVLKAKDADMQSMRALDIGTRAIDEADDALTKSQKALSEADEALRIAAKVNDFDLALTAAITKLENISVLLQDETDNRITNYSYLQELITNNRETEVNEHNSIFAKIGQEITDRTASDNNLISTDVDLLNQITAEIAGRLTADSNLLNSIENISTILSKTLASIGMIDSEGNFVLPDCDQHYLCNIDTIADAFCLIDSMLYSYSNKLGDIIDEIKSLENTVTYYSVTSDTVNTIIEAVGLNLDGSYTAPSDTTYISTSTSIEDALTILDLTIAEIYALFDELNYTDEAQTILLVNKVSETDGIISVDRVGLSSEDIILTLEDTTSDINFAIDPITTQEIIALFI